MKTIIVHGNTNNGLELSRDSIDRCLRTLELCKEIKAERIICTGGLFKAIQMRIGISHALKSWLIDNGLSADIITEENISITTIDNVKNVVELLEQGEIAYVVTSNYHSWRTGLIWRLIGRKRIILCPAQSRVTLKKLCVEAIGIMVALCWYLGFKFPEIYFRQKSRTVK